MRNSTSRVAGARRAAKREAERDQPKHAERGERGAGDGERNRRLRARENRER